MMKGNRVKMSESFQPFEYETTKVIAPVAVFAPQETVKIQQCKYQKIQHQSMTQINNVIVACSTDGRIRVFINERLDGRINEEDEDFEDFDNEGEEVSIKDSEEEDEDSDYEIHPVQKQVHQTSGWGEEE